MTDRQARFVNALCDQELVYLLGHARKYPGSSGDMTQALEDEALARGLLPSRPCTLQVHRRSGRTLAVA